MILLSVYLINNYFSVYINFFFCCGQISTSGHYLSFVPLFSGILEQLGEQTTGATIIMTALTASVNFTGKQFYILSQFKLHVHLHIGRHSMSFYRCY
jgi:hypothetical protein